MIFQQTTAKKAPAKKAPAKKTVVTEKVVAKAPAKTDMLDTNVPVVVVLAIESLILLLAYLIIMSVA